MTVGVRDRLKESYVKLLLSDYVEASSNDVDRRLWKFCFYMPVEALRQRVRSLAGKLKEEKRGPTVTQGMPSVSPKDIQPWGCMYTC